MPGYARDPLYDSDDVLIYTNSTQRTTLLPSPTVGILTYLTEDDVYEYWDGSAWTEMSGGSTVAYQTDAPADPAVGTLWIDSDATASGLNQNDFLLQSSASVTYATKEELGGAGLNPFFLPGL
jgi:hypothetical protein